MSLLNARSIVNKLPDLHYLMYHSNIDCLCITETWLSHEITDALLDPDDCYNIIRCDRLGGRGGGVAVLVRHGFTAVPVDLCQDHSGTELICFDLTDCVVPVRVLVVYRPLRLVFVII